MNTIPRAMRFWPIILFLMPIVLAACGRATSSELEFTDMTHTPSATSNLDAPTIQSLPSQALEATEPIPQPTQGSTARSPEADRIDVTPTPTPFLGEGPGKVLSFSVTSELERPGPGDEVFMSWETVGGETDICVSYGGWTNNECFDVPASGQRTYRLRTEDPVADHWVDFTLGVRDGYSGDHEVVRLPVKCHYAWFQDNLSDWCPFGPIYSFEAIGQQFEGGLVITAGQDIRVFFKEPAGSCRAYTIGPNVVNDAAPPEPPAGRFPPGEAIAILWPGLIAGTEDLRERLGWSLSPPESYLMNHQCERVPEGTGNCYISLPDGRIFSPDYIAGVPDLDGISYADGICHFLPIDHSPDS